MVASSISSLRTWEEHRDLEHVLVLLAYAQGLKPKRVVGMLVVEKTKSQ
jgi:hypothetical protein